MGFSFSNLVKGGAPGGHGFSRDSKLGYWSSVKDDPLDLFGNRARDAANQMEDIQKGAAADAIRAQMENIQRARGLYDPFVQSGATPLSELTAMITGEGDFTFTPSEAFSAGLEEQGRALRRSAAARGTLDTSGTQARLADLVNALTGQEIQGQIERRLQPVRTAQDASRILGGIESAGAGAGSSVYTNLAAQNLQNAANLGQARQSAYNSLAGGLQGLAGYFAAR